MKKYLLVFVLFILSSFVIQAQEEPKGKIHGYMFGDYFYNIARDQNSVPNSVEKGEKDFNGFQFRRIYFGYDYKISPIFSSRLRLEADQKEETSGGKFGLFVKDAYLKWNDIFSGSDLIIGLSPTPTFEISESYWGYRSLEKTIVDLRKVGSSRDFGINLKGKINSSGTIKYMLMIANGEGNTGEDNNQKKIYAHLAVEPIKNLTFSLNGDVGFQENISDPNSSGTLSNNIIKSVFFVGYKNPGNYSLGVEGFYQLTQNELTTSQAKEDAGSMGVSIFASADLSEKFALVGRYDFFDPIRNTGYEGDTRNYFLAAVNYKPDPNVWIMPNIIVETYENSTSGLSFDSAITGRLTIFYNFL